MEDNQNDINQYDINQYDNQNGLEAGQILPILTLLYHGTLAYTSLVIKIAKQ